LKAGAVLPPSFLAASDADLVGDFSATTLTAHGCRAAYPMSDRPAPVGEPKAKRGAARQITDRDNFDDEGFDHLADGGDLLAEGFDPLAGGVNPGGATAFLGGGSADAGVDAAADSEYVHVEPQRLAPLDAALDPLESSLGMKSVGSPSRLSQSHEDVEESINLTSDSMISETIDRLSYVHGVLGVVIFDQESQVIRTTLEKVQAAKVAATALQLLQRARAVVEDDDALGTLAVRTKKHEMLLSLSENGGFGIAVLQNPYLKEIVVHGTKALRQKLEKLGVDIPRGADRQWLLELLESEMLKRGM